MHLALRKKTRIKQTIAKSDEISFFLDRKNICIPEYNTICVLGVSGFSIEGVSLLKKTC